MGFGLAWLGFLDLTWVLQDLGPLIFYSRWVLHDLVLNKCGCTRLPAGCVGGYCSGFVGLDVFGLWEIRCRLFLLEVQGVYIVAFKICILRLSRVVGGYLNSFFLLLLGTLGFLFGGKLQQWLLFYNWKKTLCLPGLLPMLCFFCVCLGFGIIGWYEKINCSRGFEGFYWVDWSLLMLCFFCACFAAGYWIFVPFILFHFIGLVTAVVFGFVRVPMLSRLVVYFYTLLLFGLLKNMNSLLKLFSRFGASTAFFSSIGVVGLSCVSAA
ncbi:hypothetical protein NC651_001754 [Populus alba x Populus x berolinensis]|nr:hypothetical protein NC651_001754 [Populus alba x Populus x berolinensis]